MENAAVTLFWWALYALPVVVVVGVPVLIWAVLRRRNRADRAELEQLRAERDARRDT